MKTQPQSVVRANAAGTAKKNHAFFTTSIIGLWAFWMAFVSLNLYAQSYSELDLSEFAHAVQVQDVQLMQGEKATFEVSLGDEDAPAHHIVGMQLDLSLGSLALVSEEAGIAVDGSWCFDPTNLYTTTNAANNPAVLHLTVLSADSGAQSGAGFVFSFELEAAQDNVASSDLLAAFDGIVIIENVDMKRAQYPRGNSHPRSMNNAFSGSQMQISAPESMHCYPNPTQGRLHWFLVEAGDLASEGNIVITKLVGSDGQVYLLKPEILGSECAVDLTQFPSGIYHLQMLCAGKSLFQERILKI